MNNLIYKTTLIAIILFSNNFNFIAKAQTSFKFKTIVIDPGHGGAPGATYGSLKEKDIVLKVALKFGAKIKKHYPSVKVIYTRDKDKAVALHARSTIANNSHADLFVSIHANSAEASSATGTETFIMGYDKNKANMAVAMKENNVVTYEEDYSVKYEGFEPGSVESYIIFSLMQHSYLSQSSLFASYVQDEYTANTKMRNRGVKQAPLLVLWQSATPSVLTEIGFLSNSSDRKYIISQSGQEQIAQSLFNAFKKYKEYTERGDIETPNNTSSSTSKKEEVSSSSSIKNSDDSVIFMVQIATSSSALTINSKNFGKYYTETKVVKQNSVYKYLVGKLVSYKDALSLQSELKKYRYKDAFVVAYKGGTRVQLKDVVK